MILPSLPLLRTFIETLEARHPDDMVTVTMRVGDRRRLTEDIPPSYTLNDNV